MYLIYGIHPVESLLKQQPQDISLVILHKNATFNNSRLTELKQRLIRNKVKFKLLGESEFTKNLQERYQEIATLKDQQKNTQKINAQGVFALVKQNIKIYDEKYLLKLLDNRKDNLSKPVIVALDAIQDPHNLGAILRSSDVLAADAVLMQKHKTVGLTPSALKVASGSSTPLIIVANLATSLKRLQQTGFWIWGTNLEAKIDIFDAKFDEPTIFILGNEGNGMRPIVTKICDYLIRIPIYGKVESLNVAQVASICLYEFRRQNRDK